MPGIYNMNPMERFIVCTMLPFAVGFLAAGAHCNPEIIIGSSALFFVLAVIATRKVG